jgi:hypothetical protein
MQTMVLEYLYTNISPCPKSPSFVVKYTSTMVSLSGYDNAMYKTFKW